MIVAVTGAGGYVGGLLVRAFERELHEVRRLTRRPDAARGDRPFVLGEPVGDETLAGVEVLVHAAHDFASAREPDAFRRLNVEGSIRLFDAAASAGVRRLAFVSSAASFAGSRSLYGRGKYEVEQEVTRRGGTSVRPGMVFGPAAGGLFGALDRAAASLPVLPDLGDRARLHLVHADDLAAVAVRWLGRSGAEPLPVLPVAHPDPLSLRAILAHQAAGRGRRPAFVPAPAGVMIAGLRALEALHLPLPFRSDSLVSLLHGNPDPGFAAEVLGVRLRPLAATTGPGGAAGG